MPVAEGGGIFVSYRRQESSHLAGRLYDRLADRFGEGQVFIDVDTIEPGVDFAEEISRAVAACKVLVAIIGPNWLNAADERGGRRLDDPGDIVRLEIEAALTRGVRVIPILVESAVMPDRHDLPESLAGLARRNALLIRHESFRYDAGRLVTAIERVLEAPATAPVSSAPDAQENQAKGLDERFALRLAVTDSERVHLENLHVGSSLDYERNPSVQAELRHLRGLGLIRTKRYIGEMPEHFNLSEWVELTDQGNEYLRRTARSEQPTQISSGQSENLEKAQENQAKGLDERFALRLAVTDSERVHLENLHVGSSLDYERNPSVQAELRHLRGLGLIRTKRYIGEMPEHFNLSEWVELTDQGNEYLRRTAE